jgi:hypothetical protein
MEETPKREKTTFVDLTGEKPFVIQTDLLELCGVGGRRSGERYPDLALRIVRGICEEGNADSILAGWAISDQFPNIFREVDEKTFSPADAVNPETAKHIGCLLANLTLLESQGNAESHAEADEESVLFEALAGLTRVINRHFSSQPLEPGEPLKAYESRIFDPVEDTLIILQKFLNRGFTGLTDEISDAQAELAHQYALDAASRAVKSVHDETPAHGSIDTTWEKQFLNTPDNNNRLGPALAVAMDLIALIPRINSSLRINTKPEHAGMISTIAEAQINANPELGEDDPGYKLLYTVFKRILDELRIHLDGGRNSPKAHIRLFNEWVDGCMKAIAETSTGDTSGLLEFIEGIRIIAITDNEMPSLNDIETHPTETLTTLHNASNKYMVNIGDSYSLGDNFAGFLVAYIKANGTDIMSGGPIPPKVPPEINSSFFWSLNDVLNNFCNIMTRDGNRLNGHVFDGLIEILWNRIDTESKDQPEIIINLIGALILIKSMRGRTKYPDSE